MGKPHKTPSSAATPVIPGRVIVLCLLLALVTLVAYRDAGSCNFVNLDDDAYVEFQPMVNQGIRSASLLWAFTGVHSTNWHPLTSLSHILDCSLFGLQPGPMHWENVAWHILNSLLVFLFWRSISGRTWPAAFVAALFALHPLHVESVVWISERKDVLSAFFWLLGLGAYVHYTRAPSLSRYALLLVCFALGLLAKPMLITFPFTLLLLDFWPLKRFAGKSWRSLFYEKIPLFALAFVHAIITILVQSGAGSANYGARFSLMARLGNALVSCVRYLGKMIWPSSLSPFYAHPGYWPLWAVLGSLALLLSISVLAWMQRAARPWFLFGWLWFLITLAPVIGLLQVGAQSMADRYTYIPLLGIFTILAWAGEELVSRLPKMRVPLAATACIVIAICFLLTQRQVGAWENSVILYQRTIAAGTDNATIRFLLATAMQSSGHTQAEVKAQYEKSIGLQHDYVNAYTQLCLMAIGRKDYKEAMRLVQETLAFEPDNPVLRKNLGALNRLMGNTAEAEKILSDALKIAPNSVDIHRELGWMYMQQNQLDKARDEFDAITHLDPWDFSAWNDFGVVYLRSGNRVQALRCFERALSINPKFTAAEANIRIVSQVNSI